MSDDEPHEQQPAIVRAAGRLTAREKALITATATLALLAGLLCRSCAAETSRNRRDEL